MPLAGQGHAVLVQPAELKRLATLHKLGRFHRFLGRKTIRRAALIFSAEFRRPKLVADRILIGGRLGFAAYSGGQAHYRGAENCTGQ